MLGRSLQTQTFVIDQAGANRVKYIDSIYPQNNQVSDIVYGQSTGGQAPVNTYNPYYPKIERTMERKITPQDVFRAQNKQVQKLVTSARLSNLPQWMEGEKPSLGEIKQEPSPRYEDDSTSFGTASQGTFEASDMTSSTNTISQWLGTQIQDVNSTANIIETTNPIEDERVSLEVEDDLQATTNVPASLPGLWPGLRTPTFSRPNRPPMIQTGNISQLNFATPPPSSNRRVEEFINSIPRSAMNDQRVVTAMNDVIQQVADNAPQPVLNEAVQNLEQQLSNVGSPVSDLASRIARIRLESPISPSAELARRLQREEAAEIVNIENRIRQEQGLPLLAPAYSSGSERLPPYFYSSPRSYAELSDVPMNVDTPSTGRGTRRSERSMRVDTPTTPSPTSSGDRYVPPPATRRQAENLPTRRNPSRRGRPSRNN
jgi:hypothetical protein